MEKVWSHGIVLLRGDETDCGDSEWSLAIVVIWSVVVSIIISQFCDQYSSQRPLCPRGQAARQHPGWQGSQVNLSLNRPPNSQWHRCPSRPCTDGFTRSGVTITYLLQISGGVLSVVVTTEWHYNPCRISDNNSNNNKVLKSEWRHWVTTVCGRAVLQIEQYAVDFVQHQMDPLYAINTTAAQQVLQPSCHCFTHCCCYNLSVNEECWM